MQDHRDAAVRSRPRPDDQLLDEAAEWIGRLRAADIATADRQAFSRWLIRSPAHRAAFDTMADLWDGLGALAASGDRLGSAADPSGPSRLAVDAAARRSTRSSPRRSIRTPVTATAAAAAASCALAASLLIALVLVIAPWRDIHETAPGERLTVELEDGSEVLLNTATRVEIHYSRNRRSIELAPGGEAFFTVAPDAERPFVVTSAHGTARALGTRFAVRAEDHRTLVSVTEGRVAIRSREGLVAEPRAVASGSEAGSEVEVGAGSQVSVSAGAPPAAPAPIDDHLLEWRNGRLIYDDVPLIRLVDDLNRYLPTRMTIADPELAATRVSAVLTITDQTTMLKALSRALPMKWMQVSDQLVIIHPA